MSLKERTQFPKGLKSHLERRYGQIISTKAGNLHILSPLENIFIFRFWGFFFFCWMRDNLTGLIFHKV